MGGGEGTDTRLVGKDSSSALIMSTHNYIHYEETPLLPQYEHTGKRTDTESTKVIFAVNKWNGACVHII